MNDEIVVVGAGPYGLSIAAHLRARGSRVRVFGEPMGSWRHNMPAGMFLKSTPSASSLRRAGRRRDPRRLPPRDGRPALRRTSRRGPDRGVRRLRALVRRPPRARRRGVLGEPHRSPRPRLRDLRGRRRDGEDEVGRRRERSRRARVRPARAHCPRARRSVARRPVVACLPARRLRGLRGRSASRSIGAGQSALESAALLHEAGADVVVLVRAPQVRWGGPDSEPSLLSRIRAPQSGLGPGWRHRALTDVPNLVRFLPASARRFLVANVLGPFGAWWLHDRVEGLVDIQLGHARRPAPTPATTGDVRLELAEAGGGVGKLDVDHVIAATGYRVDVGAHRLPRSAARRGAAHGSRHRVAGPRLRVRVVGAGPVLRRTRVGDDVRPGDALRLRHALRRATDRARRRRSRPSS